MTQGPTAAEAAFAALVVGKKITVRKTIGESDVYLFAGITGDFSPNHVDEAFMRGTRYGHRIAHGALLIGYISRASTEICVGLPGTIVSYGFERIRFPHAALIGDTVAVEYEIIERDAAERKTFARVTCTTDRGDVVAAGTHILKVVE